MKERILLFDGICILCNAAFNFVVRIDRKHKVKYGVLQNEKVQQLLRQRGLSDQTLSTLVYIRGEQILIKSRAILFLFWDIGGIWRLSAVFFIIPRIWRDGLYDYIARNRYRWFGRRSSCRKPEEELADRCY